MCSTIGASQFCYHGNIRGSRPSHYPQDFSDHVWPSIMIFVNGISYAWSSKHINMLAWVCKLSCVSCKTISLAKFQWSVLQIGQDSSINILDITLVWVYDVISFLISIFYDFVFKFTRTNNRRVFVHTMTASSHHLVASQAQAFLWLFVTSEFAGSRALIKGRYFVWNLRYSLTKQSYIKQNRIKLPCHWRNDSMVF